MFALVPPSGTPSNYQIKNSLRFNAPDSASMSRAFTPSGTTATFSFWTKRTALGSIQEVFGWSNGSTVSFGVSFSAADQLDHASYSSGYNARKLTNRVFRDVSAWYHVVCVVDTTNATAADRMRVYINGVRETSFAATVDPTQNLSTALSSNTTWGIGVQTGTNAYYFSGYLSEFNFIDGQALDASSFGKTDSVTGQWIPKKYLGTYGTTGFYLPFNDGTSTITLGYDRSGNSNNWTLSNLNITAGVDNDWLSDTPTNNYCVLNAVDKNATTTTVNGSLELTNTGSNVQQLVRGTAGVSAGKWYWEAAATINNGIYVGIANTTCSLSSASAKSIYINQAGQVYVDQNITVNATLPSSYATNDVYGVAVDLDGGSISWYKNGVLNGSYSFTPGSHIWMPLIGNYTANSKNIVNFGQRAFIYTPPSGFKSLCSLHLQTPPIKKSSNYFDVDVWSGDGTSSRVIPTTINTPDFIWVKVRTDNTKGHILFDTVRGLGGNKELDTNAAVAESGGQTATYGYVSGTGTNSFTVASGSTNAAYVNASGQSYVAWNWKAGGTAVVNTVGTITSQVSANPTSGFSVVTYTGNGVAGATFGHGLGVVPSVVIVKSRSAATNWVMYNSQLGNVGSLYLNLTNAGTTIATWNNTTPTSSVVTINGTGYYVNDSAATYVAYCFAEVPGFSKFGYYTGNGLADGPFVNCGFKPKYLLVKRSDTAASWYVTDAGRDLINEVQTFLYPDLANADSVGGAGTYREDFLSNGFKLRGTGADINASGGTYIFMAFAHAPFKYSTAR